MCIHDFIFEREIQEDDTVRTLSSGVKVGEKEPPHKKYKAEDQPKTSALISSSNVSGPVNTGFWSILEDDRWTHMQEEECSANNASGRLNACAVGYSGRR